MLAALAATRQARRMTGGGLLELILLSMAWLFFLGGLAANYQVLRRSLRAKAGEAVPPGLGFVPRVVGSLTVFFTIPALAKYGVDVPRPRRRVLPSLLLAPPGP